MKLILFTTPRNKEVYINPEHVAIIKGHKKDKGYTKIMLGYGDFSSQTNIIVVNENLETVKRKLVE